MYFSTISINSYPETSDLCVLNVIFFICVLISVEKPFMSFKNGKKQTLCAAPLFPFLPSSDVSTSLPSKIHTLSLYIIPPSSNSYASPVSKNLSISSITYGDAQSIIPTIFIPFFSAHSFAIFAKFSDFAAVIFIGFPLSLRPICTCKSANTSYMWLLLIKYFASNIYFINRHLE